MQKIYREAQEESHPQRVTLVVKSYTPIGFYAMQELFPLIKAAEFINGGSVGISRKVIRFKMVRAHRGFITGEMMRT